MNPSNAAAVHEAAGGAPAALPRHVAIIMDGNGRWAQRRGLPRHHGHRAGVQAVRRVVRHARSLGIEALTLFAFSAQNWRRPRVEVAALMGLLARFARRERRELVAQGIRVVVAGDTAPLPAHARRALDALVRATSQCGDMTLCLAINYGGREDILRAARAVARAAARGELDPEAIDAGTFARYLWTSVVPCPPDLVIRTSGEQRLSNFTLWDAAWAEFCFCDVLWPDFDEEQLEAALRDFARRQRRYGGAPASSQE